MTVRNQGRDQTKHGQTPSGSAVKAALYVREKAGSPIQTCHNEPACQIQVYRSGWYQLKSVCHGVANHGPSQAIRNQGLRTLWQNPIMNNEVRIGANMASLETIVTRHRLR